MKKTILIAMIAFFPLSVSSVLADEIPTGMPPGQAVKQLRQQNKAERQQIHKENREMRKNLIEENKREREQFRKNTKDMLKGKTIEERKALKPTIVQQRKDLFNANKEERKTLRQNVADKLASYWKKVKTDFWSSIFKK